MVALCTGLALRLPYPASKGRVAGAQVMTYAPFFTSAHELFTPHENSQPFPDNFKISWTGDRIDSDSSL